MSSNAHRLAACSATAVRVWAAVVSLVEDGEERTTRAVMERTGLGRRSVETGRAELQRAGILPKMTREQANELREQHAIGVDDPRRVMFRARRQIDRQAQADEARRQVREATTRGEAHQLAVILEYLRHVDGKRPTRACAQSLAETVGMYGADATMVGVIVMTDFDHASGAEHQRWGLVRQFAARYVWENAD